MNAPDDEQPWLLTLHEDGEEKTLRFPSEKARQAYLDELKCRPDLKTGPMIPDEQFSDYIERKETTLDNGGIFFELTDEGVHCSISEEAHERVAAEATAAGLDVQSFMQQQLDEYVKKHKSGQGDSD